MTSVRAERASRVAFWVVTAATIAPLWSVRYLPFTDLPEHVAAIATVAHLLERASPDAQIYEIAFSRCQYLLYHGSGGLLTLVVGDAVLANRLLLTAVAVAFPLSVRSALRAFGKDEALALLACLPLLSRPLFVGFLPYVASMPLYFFGVALVARNAREPSRRRELVLVLYTFVLFFTHASTTVVFLATAGVLQLVFAAQKETATVPWITTTVRRGMWLAPGVAALVAWSVLGRVTLRSQSLSGPGEIGTMSLYRAIRALPLWSFDVFNTHLDEVCGGLWWALLAVFALLSQRREARPTRGGIVGLVAGIDPAYAPLLALGAAYVLTPFRIGAGGMLNVRLAPLIALAAVLTVERSKHRARSYVLAIAAVTTLVHAANVGLTIRAVAQTEVSGIDRILDAIPPGAKVVSLQFDARRSVTRFDPYPFVASYHRAKGGGIASYSFSDLVHWPIQYRPGEAPPAKAAGLWIYEPCQYRNATDGPAYDYVLVGGAVDPFAGEPEGPSFRLIEQVKGYALYEKDPTTLWDGPDDGPCHPDP